MQIEENYNKKKVKEWFINLIECFREKYEQLNEKEKSQFPYNIGFSYGAPCQIEIFWLKEPMEYQIIVITHDISRDDMEIIINGPYKGYEFLDEIEKTMEEQRWNKPIPKDSPCPGAQSGTVKYSDRFAYPVLCNFLPAIRQSVFLRIKKGIHIGGMQLVPEVGCDLVSGNITELDYNNVIEKSINEAKLRAKSISEEPQETKAFSQPAPRLKGYGALFYPPVRIGNAPERTFRQKALHQDPNIFSSKVFDSTFNNKKIVVCSDGFIGIEAEKKEDALRILNTIFGVFFIFDTPYFSVRESELSEIDIAPIPLEIYSKSIPTSSLRTLFMDGIIPRPFVMDYDHKRAEISEEKIKEFIKKAEKISQNKDLAEQLVFLLEGYTHHKNTEYSQSFIINWLIVEKHLDERCKVLLKEKQIKNKNSKGKLTNTTSWSVDRILKTLSLCEKIDSDEYNLLMELKTKRNAFVHRGELIDESTSKKLLDFSSKIVKAYINFFIENVVK